MLFFHISYSVKYCIPSTDIA